MLTHFSLFTGIGGIDLAAEWAGFQTVGQCELADYPYKVLCKHWPHVPKWRDIRDVTAESVKQAGIGTITVLSGGFPCQPFSIAGKRRGKEDDRYLWPEMLRVISELKPAWVVGENVAGIVNLALDNVLSDLEGVGYSTQTFVIPACAVNAFHRRDRVFVVAYAESKRRKRFLCGNLERFAKETGPARKIALDAQGNPFLQFEKRVGEPAIFGICNGIPNRVDRLKCLGNAVVPQQVYPILKAIYEIETKGNEA